MKNPETCDEIAAADVLRLADCIGHSLTVEELHAQAQQCMINLYQCPLTTLRTQAMSVAIQIEAFATSSQDETNDKAEMLSDATEILRKTLNAKRGVIA